MYFSRLTKQSTESFSEQIDKLQNAIESADAVVIGAGAGLSAAAGYTYADERFERLFGDFAAKYGFSDMYAGGFYPYKTFEEHWAFWSRYIVCNRFDPIPKPVYEELLELVRGRDYFVLTTNVDHCFQRAGFDKHRLFYTQGDYGLFQCSRPCCQKNLGQQRKRSGHGESTRQHAHTKRTCAPLPPLRIARNDEPALR